MRWARTLRVQWGRYLLRKGRSDELGPLQHCSSAEAMGGEGGVVRELRGSLRRVCSIQRVSCVRVEWWAWVWFGGVGSFWEVMRSL